MRKFKNHISNQIESITLDCDNILLQKCYKKLDQLDQIIKTLEELIENNQIIENDSIICDKNEKKIIEKLKQELSISRENENLLATELEVSKQNAKNLERQVFDYLENEKKIIEKLKQELLISQQNENLLAIELEYSKRVRRYSNR